MEDDRDQPRKTPHHLDASGTNQLGRPSRIAGEAFSREDRDRHRWCLLHGERRLLYCRSSVTLPHPMVEEPEPCRHSTAPPWSRSWKSSTAGRAREGVEPRSFASAMVRDPAYYLGRRPRARCADRARRAGRRRELGTVPSATAATASYYAAPAGAHRPADPAHALRARAGLRRSRRAHPGRRSRRRPRTSSHVPGVSSFGSTRPGADQLSRRAPPSGGEHRVQRPWRTASAEEPRPRRHRTVVVSSDARTDP